MAAFEKVTAEVTASLATSSNSLHDDQPSVEITTNSPLLSHKENNLLVVSQVEEDEEAERISLLASSKSQHNELNDKEDSTTAEEEEGEEDKDSLLSSSTSSITTSKCWDMFGLQSFLKSYRSTNPQKRITPFALILLLVLLSLYILSQADRLVLAVLIPSGLRCQDNVTISNNTDYSSCPAPPISTPLNGTLNDDCVPFDDTEKGLLTGPAFVVVYVLVGLPLAYLADTRSCSLVLLCFCNGVLTGL